MSASEDFRDATRTERFYDRAPALVDADLDVEEAELVEDMLTDEVATEDLLADLAERYADWRRDDAVGWDAA